MNVWIVADDHEVASRIREDCRGLELNSADWRSISVAGAKSMLPEIAESDDLVILAEPKLVTVKRILSAKQFLAGREPCMAHPVACPVR